MPRRSAEIESPPSRSYDPPAAKERAWDSTRGGRMLDVLRRVGKKGATCIEITDLYNTHQFEEKPLDSARHVSTLLSRLVGDRAAFQLHQQRDKQHIHVHADFLREYEPGEILRFGPNYYECPSCGHRWPAGS
jgi:hypothetical protein